VAIGSVALISTVLISTWGYDAARQILSAELSVSLQAVGDLAQNQVDLEGRRTTEHLTGVSTDAARALSPGGGVRGFSAQLRAIDLFNPHYLELDALDAHGTIRASSHNLEGRTPADRIGTAFNLEGRNYVSEPRKVAQYPGRILYISVPVKSPSGAIIGSLG